MTNKEKEMNHQKALKVSQAEGTSLWGVPVVENEPVQSGGASSYSGGSSRSTAAVAEPAFDKAAYLSQMVAQQEAALERYRAEQTAAFDHYLQSQLAMFEQSYSEQSRAAQNAFNQNATALRQNTDLANAGVDKNSSASMEQARLNTNEALREANILRQQAERGLPTLSLMSGGGGLSESALMDVYNSYHQSRDEYNTAFANTQKEMQLEADNQKAVNEQNYTRDMAELHNYFTQQQADYAKTKTEAQTGLQQEKARFEQELAQMIAQNRQDMVMEYAYFL